MNTLRTNTSVPQQQQAPTQGFFGRMVGGVKRVITETFAAPAPARAATGPDSYVKGQPLSIAAQRRLSLQNSGMKANRASNGASEDAQLVAYLNHLSNTGDPMPQDVSPTRIS